MKNIFIFLIELIFIHGCDKGVKIGERKVKFEREGNLYHGREKNLDSSFTWYV